jgi:hypothetical protein
MAIAMTLALWFGGIAQAAHFHKDELGQRGESHLHCLMCLYAGGNATPPEAPQLVVGAAVVRLCAVATPASLPTSFTLASYDARGPPRA